MSHFSILVIGEDAEKQLAPFHQFECTGRDDKFVLDIDKTAEIREEFEKDTKRQYRDAKGGLHDPYQDKFYREMTPAELEEHTPMGSGCGGGLSWTSKDWKDGKGYRAKAHFVPAGFESVEVPRKEVESFLEYAKGYHGKEAVEFGQKPDLKKVHKYGYALLDENGEVKQIIDRTNPNYKWDWYQLGGRWTGFFKKKPGTNGELGEHGAFDNKPEPGHVDSIRVGDIDFEGMRADAAREAKSKYERVEHGFAGTIPKLDYTWEEVINGDRFKTLSIEEKRAVYHSQPAMVRLKRLQDKPGQSREDRDLFVWLEFAQYQVSKEEFIQKAKDAAISTFAVLKDGKWFERGEMGWFGCVSNEKEQDQWNVEFGKLLEGLPPETLVSVYDCHI